MSVPVLSQLFGASPTDNGHESRCPSRRPPPASSRRSNSRRQTSPAARASSPRAARLPEAARQAQPLEPILLPRFTDLFCRLPYLHCSIDQRLFTLETCCGYRYDQARESLRRSSDFQGRRQRTGRHPSVALGRAVEPISGQPDSRLEARREEKTTLPGTAAGVSEFARVAAIGRGRLRAPVREVNPIPCRWLAPSPTEQSADERTPSRLGVVFPSLRSTNPCPTAVHTEPFPTSVFKVLP